MSADSEKPDATLHPFDEGNRLGSKEDRGLKETSGETTGAAGISDELRLLRLAVDGDSQAFGAFFKSKRARYHRLAARICGPAEADDVVQVVFLRLWKVLPTMQDLNSVDAWLNRTTVNRAIDVLRHIGRKLKIVVTEKRHGLQKMYVEPLHRGEITQVFNRAAERLGDRQRIAFILREMEGFSSVEAGELMGISGSTVRNLVKQARAGLRKAVRELFPEYAPVNDKVSEETHEK